MAALCQPVEADEESVGQNLDTESKLWTCDFPPEEEHDLELEEGFEGRYGGLVTLQKVCKKNPGHLAFVAVSDFSTANVDTVPLGLTKQEIVDYLTTWAGLVVRIEVKFVSNNRPDKKYPLSHRRGLPIRHTGSGWVQRVFGPEEGPCECGHCPDKDDRKCWKILVLTACHVIFDNEEANKCDIILFDDNPDGSGTQRLKGHSVQYSAPEDIDAGRLVCFTSDEDLARKLHALCERGDDMREKMEERMKEACRGPDDDTRKEMDRNKKEVCQQMCERGDEMKGEMDQKTMDGACEQADGLNIKYLRQKASELGRRFRETKNTRKDVAERKSTLKQVSDCIEQRLEELKVKVENRDAEEIDSTIRQTLVILSDRTGLDEIDSKDRVLMENLSDRLDNATDKSGCQTLRELWASRDEIKLGISQREEDIASRRDKIVDDMLALFSDPSIPPRPVYVIGHPHGRMKYITVGHAKTWDGSGDQGPAVYRVATCPGNSGGLALVLPTELNALLDVELGKFWWWWRLPDAISHSRARPSTGVGVSVKFVMCVDSQSLDFGNSLMFPPRELSLANHLTNK